MPSLHGVGKGKGKGKGVLGDAVMRWCLCVLGESWGFGGWLGVCLHWLADGTDRRTDGRTDGHGGRRWLGRCGLKDCGICVSDL